MTVADGRQARVRAQPEAAIVCPRYPYPPVSGGVKRSLRLAECMARAGLRVLVLTDDTPSRTSVQALYDRGWDSLVAHDSRRRFRRAQQHLLLLPGPRSGELMHALAHRVQHSAALVQFEGVVGSSHLSGKLTTPIIFSSQNVEAELARSAAKTSTPLSGQGLRARYHAQRVAFTESRTSRRADAVICVSQSDAEAFAPLARHVVIAPNGVDEEFFAVAPAEANSADVLFFGQFTYAPNLDGLARFLAEGWPVLAQLRPSSRLLIAGEGSRERIRPTGRDAHRVTVLGLVDDIAATVSRARLTVVPIWRGGGTRLKVLESLAAMRPVVGTSLGVSGVGFESGRHGLVAETPVELAQATAALLEQTERTDMMAHEGRRMATAYSWKRALGPAEQLYAEYGVVRKCRA